MKRLINYKNFSIGKKFTVTFFLLLILPLFLLFLWINSSVTRRITQETCKTNLAVLKQTKTGLVNFVQDITSVSIDVLGNENLQSYLKENISSKEAKEDLKNEIQYDLGNIISLKNYISRLAVFDEKELFFQTGKYMLQEDHTYLPEVLAASGRMVWKPAARDENYLLNRNKQSYEISMYRAINSLDDYREALGIERINIEEAYVCDIYSGIASKYTKDFLVMNQEGEVISSLNKEWLGTSSPAELYLSHIAGKQEGYYMDDSRNLIVSFYYLPKVQWYVVKIDDRSAIMAQEILRSMIIICMLLAMIFGMFFYRIQKKRIIEPIIHLSRDVSLFHEGQYAIGSYSDANDEIAVLNNNFIEMGNYIQDLIERVYKSQLREKEAQLQYLQSQINPHFLYNTLDSMRWMAVKEQQYDLAEQIEALSSLFKHALNQGKKMTTVEKEVQHLKDYLTIQENRFGSRIQAEIVLEEGLASCKVLNLVLQPLVENAIVHGLEGKIEGGCVSVHIKRSGEDILYLVEDNGIGTDQEKINKSLEERVDTHNALALDNINQRIKCQYGEKYGIHFHSELGVGTLVEVRMPLEGEDAL